LWNLTLPVIIIFISLAMSTDVDRFVDVLNQKNVLGRNLVECSVVFAKTIRTIFLGYWTIGAAQGLSLAVIGIISKHFLQ
jgi:bacteriorhodopsin